MIVTGSQVVVGSFVVVLGVSPKAIIVMVASLHVVVVGTVEVVKVVSPSVQLVGVEMVEGIVVEDSLQPIEVVIVEIMVIVVRWM